ncbi:MAG: hypothetical protein Q4B86_00685 [Eubacteriales bacterium]|nr:hypothetical protein [Eubacteriales bacterium]
MAKEIIDAVKAAELKAAEDIKQAKAQADATIKAAKEAAKKEHDELLDRACKDALTRKKEAELKAEAILSEANELSVKAADELKASVRSKEDEAVKSVISSLLEN